MSQTSIADPRNPLGGPRSGGARGWAIALAIVGWLACTTSLAGAEPGAETPNRSRLGDNGPAGDGAATMAEIQADELAHPETNDGGWALDPVRARVRAPYVELGAVDSRPDERSLPVFLLRVAQIMDRFTRATGYETCGVILTNPEHTAWRVRLTSNRAQIACVAVVFVEPGFARLGPDIHSHPTPSGAVAVNAQDHIYRPDLACGRAMRIDDAHFSTTDLRRGPGYLVNRGRLLYQHGSKHPVMRIGSFEPDDALYNLPLSGTSDLPKTTPGGTMIASAGASDATGNRENTDGWPSIECKADPAPARIGPR